MRLLGVFRQTEPAFLKTHSQEFLRLFGAGSGRALIPLHRGRLAAIDAKAAVIHEGEVKLRLRIALLGERGHEFHGMGIITHFSRGKGVGIRIGPPSADRQLTYPSVYMPPCSGSRMMPSVPPSAIGNPQAAEVATACSMTTRRQRIIFFFYFATSFIY